MRKSLKKNIFIFLSCLVILVAYNNCGFGPGFESNNEIGSVSDLDHHAGPSDKEPSTPPPTITNQSSFNSVAKVGANNSSPFRMLTAFEVRNSINDLFKIDIPEIQSQNLLPSFSEEMFTNFQENINISQVHVSGLKQIAKLLTGQLTENKLKQTVACINVNLTETCINNIIDTLTLNLFRKKIDSKLKAKYLQFLNTYKTDGFEGTRLFVTALIQSPSFILRQEVGTLSGTHYTLNSFEIASRMSYFITGSKPDKILFDLAKNNQLSNQNIRKEQALRLFSLEKAKKNIYKINKELFRIDKFDINKNLATLFTQESENLLNDIIFENDKPWTDLFTAEGSYMNGALKKHYGLNGSENSFVWTPYIGDRSGILSHGSFLSYQFNGDPESTSPIKRGLQIVEDLLCKHLPPPSDVDIDDDPAAKLTNECKIEARKLTTLRPGGSCTGCHNFMEPLGLSLERFNMLGQYRTVEKNRPECSTLEPGQVDGVHFNSMKKLGTLIAEHQDINLCLTKRVLSYAFGNYVLNSQALSYNRDLASFNKNKTFKNLLIDIVTSPQFIRRDL